MNAIFIFQSYINYSLRFKMSVVLTNCMQIKELNEIPLLLKRLKKEKIKVALKIVREKSLSIY